MINHAMPSKVPGTEQTRSEDKPLDEAKLREQIVSIEALFAGVTTSHRISAEEHRRRILLRLQKLSQSEPTIENRFLLSDAWARKVLVTLLRRYGLKPYRYRMQHRATIMVKAPKPFITEIIYPEFLKMTMLLREFVDAVLDQIIVDTIHSDYTDPPAVPEPPRARNRRSGEART